MSATGNDGRPRHPTPLSALTIGDYLAWQASSAPRDHKVTDMEADR